MSIACGRDWPSSKPDARKALIRWRNALSDADRQQRTDRIGAAVTHCLQRIANGALPGHAPTRIMQRDDSVQQVLGVFWPIRGEPDLRAHYPEWRKIGFDLALPVTPDQPGPLTFVRWDPADAMTSDKMGIQVPVVRNVVSPDVLVIPCLGYFDHNLRLGYGGGYYDRTLAGFGGLSIGVAFAETCLPGLQAEPHDYRLSWILTDG